MFNCRLSKQDASDRAARSKPCQCQPANATGSSSKEPVSCEPTRKPDADENCPHPCLQRAPPSMRMPTASLGIATLVRNVALYCKDSTGVPLSSQFGAQTGSNAMSVHRDLPRNCRKSWNPESSAEGCALVFGRFDSGRGKDTHHENTIPKRKILFISCMFATVLVFFQAAITCCVWSPYRLASQVSLAIPSPCQPTDLVFSTPPSLRQAVHRRETSVASWRDSCMAPASNVEKQIQQFSWRKFACCSLRIPLESNRFVFSVIAAVSVLLITWLKRKQPQRRRVATRIVPILCISTAFLCAKGQVCMQSSD
jgi:hypothetical protein